MDTNKLLVQQPINSKQSRQTIRPNIMSHSGSSGLRNQRKRSRKNLRSKSSKGDNDGSVSSSIPISKVYLGGPLHPCDMASSILLVDDNMLNLASLQTMIRMRFGINTSLCSNGKMTIKFIEQRIQNLELSMKSQGLDNQMISSPLVPPIPIIFMDCQMPQMDGYMTSKQISEKCKLAGLRAPYIVALTASTEQDSILNNCQKYGLRQII